MAHDPLPLAEMLKINDMNVADVDGISDLLQGAPLLAAVFADVASQGTTHKYLKETTAPVVGFRSVNDGREHDHSEDTLVTIALEILDASFHVDSALAEQYKFGAAAYMARETQRHIRASFSMAEKQLINGTVDGEASGYTGLQDAATINATGDAMVVNAGGASALSSVYAIRSVGDLTDFLLITGNEGNIDVAPVYSQMMPGATGHFNAYVQPIQSYLGVQIGSIFSVGRICNLDASSNSLTDDLLSDLLSLAPADKPFTHLVMNRRSRKQLQKSRTATTTTGAPAPFPTEAFGVPIVTTDSVLNTETVVGA